MGSSSDEPLEDITPDEVEQCIQSFRDHNTFIRFNRDPCDKMISYLRKYFKPTSAVRTCMHMCMYMFRSRGLVSRYRLDAEGRGCPIRMSASSITFFNP